MSSVEQTRSQGIPAHIDVTKASVARVYDAFLNGKDNYEIDREVLRGIQRVAPEATRLGWDNREFLIRATRFIAGQTGITQYLDCGSGLPTAENTHQVAQRIRPDSRVVYVDNDPVVLAHGRALLEDNFRVRMVEADIFKPASVMENEIVRASLDFTRPMVMLQVGTMHHVEGDHGPDIMREYVDALPSGSYVVFSHFCDPEVPELTAIARRIENILVSGPMGAGRFRTRTEILAMLDGLELIKPNAQAGPGLSVCDEWWPDGPRLNPLSDAARCIIGGVGYKA
jgi:hypothetical protein